MEGGRRGVVAEVLRGLLTPCHLDISIHNVATEVPSCTEARSTEETQCLPQGQSVSRKQHFCWVL